MRFWNLFKCYLLWTNVTKSPILINVHAHNWICLLCFFFVWNYYIWVNANKLHMYIITTYVLVFLFKKSSSSLTIKVQIQFIFGYKKKREKRYVGMEEASLKILLAFIWFLPIFWSRSESQKIPKNSGIYSIFSEKNNRFNGIEKLPEWKYVVWNYFFLAIWMCLFSRFASLLVANLNVLNFF